MNIAVREEEVTITLNRIEAIALGLVCGKVWGDPNHLIRVVTDKVYDVVCSEVIGNHFGLLDHPMHTAIEDDSEIRIKWRHEKQDNYYRD